MVEKAKEKGLYKELEAMFLGNGDIPDKWKAKYNCLLCAGSLVPGHIPPTTGFDQMYDCVLPGGYILYSVRDRYYEPLGHKAKVESMVSAGKLKFVKQFAWVRNEEMEGEKKTELFYPEPASVYVYQRL